jgi:diaminopimelate epimerase
VETLSKTVNYQIYIPGGNDTGFVLGTNYTQEERKIINDKIMEKHPNVEQVGFLSQTGQPSLEMAGGEFCGNATRSAAYYFLAGKEGKLTLMVNGKDKITAGVSSKQEAWCEIPLLSKEEAENMVIPRENGIYQAKMKGMVSIVIPEEQAKPYLAHLDTIKEETRKMIYHYGLQNSEAVGVMYLENAQGKIKIHPVVWVNSIDTLFYETACGSGTTATSMVQAYCQKKSVSLSILQPSGYFIEANIDWKEGTINKAVISGKVTVDPEQYGLIID